MLQNTVSFLRYIWWSNRNKQIADALVYTVQTTHVTIIHQKFLQRGHSQMEVDSMHSAIELAKRNVAVYTMIDWLNIFRSARRRNPYTVVAYNSCHMQTSMI